MYIKINVKSLFHFISSKHFLHLTKRSWWNELIHITMMLSTYVLKENENTMYYIFIAEQGK